MRILIIFTAFSVLLSHNAAGFLEQEPHSMEGGLHQTGMPLGGFGSGSVEYLPDGWFGNARGGFPHAGGGRLRSMFMAVQANDGFESTARMLRLNRSEEYADVINVPTVIQEALYPAVSTEFEDGALPVLLQTHAFSSMANPAPDSENSLILLEVTARNLRSATTDVSFLVNWQPMSEAGVFSSTAYHEKGLAAVLFSATDAAAPSAQFLVGTATDDVSVSYLPHWEGEGNTIPFWSEFAASGQVSGATEESGGLLARFSLGPLEARTLPFVLCWSAGPMLASVTEAAHRGMAHSELLLAMSLEWRDMLLDSSLPRWLVDSLIHSAGAAVAGSSHSASGVNLLGPMDERLAGQSFLTAFFPALDRSELEYYGLMQDHVQPMADGRIPRLANGGAHAPVSDVSNGPLVTSAWIVQVLKHYRETGDEVFLARLWPRVCRAAGYLQSADLDGDSLPEAADEFVHESKAASATAQNANGAPVMTAGLYLAALQSAIEAAKALGDEVHAEAYKDKFDAAQMSFIMNLWNGERFFRRYDHLEGIAAEGHTLAPLLGDWFARANGCTPPFGPGVAEPAIQPLLGLLAANNTMLPPMEFDSAGCASRFVSIPWLLETAVACEAIRLGAPGEGIALMRRVHEINLARGSPWDMPVAYTWPETQALEGTSSAGALSVWNALPALSGVSVDLNNETLCLSPVLPPDMDALHMPVFLAPFWLWLDYVPGEKVLTIRVLKRIAPVGAEIKWLRANGEAEPFRLSRPIPVETGVTADLWVYREQLMLDRSD